MINGVKKYADIKGIEWTETFISNIKESWCIYFYFYYHPQSQGAKMNEKINHIIELDKIQ